MPETDGIDLQSLSDYSSAVANTISSQADQADAQATEAGKTGIAKVTMHADGKTVVEGHKDYFDQIIGQARQGIQLHRQVSQVEQLLQQELAKVQSRENAYNRSPILSALANIAGNMAQQKNMPGIVQALGRSSVQLNPPPQELSNQKMTILGALEQAERNRRQEERQDFTDSLQAADFALRSGREARLEKSNEDAAVAKVMGDFAKDAASKTFDPLSARAAASAVIKDPAKVEAVVKYYSGKQARQEINDQVKESIKDKKEEDRFNRQLALEDKRETASLNRMIAGASMRAEDAADKALTIPKDRQIKDLGGYAETDLYLDRVEKALNDPALAREMGQLNVNKLAPLFAKSSKFVELQNLLAHETPRILNLVLRGGQGGASLLRTEEGRQMIRKLGVIQDMTLDQARAVIPNIRDQVHDNRMATMAETPRAHWENYKDLLGRDAPAGTSEDGVIKTKIVNGRIVIDDGK